MLPLEISAPDQTASFSPTSGAGSFDVTFDLLEDPSNSGFPNATQGFSIGLGHPSSLLSVTGGGAAGVTLGLNGGNGPDFFDVNTYTAGITFGCVYSFTNPGTSTLLFDVAQPIVSASYETIPGAFTGQQNPVVVSLTSNSGLGSPPVEQVVVVNSQSQGLFVAGCDIELAPGGGIDRVHLGPGQGLRAGGPSLPLAVEPQGGLQRGRAARWPRRVGPAPARRR